MLSDALHERHPFFHSQDSTQSKHCFEENRYDLGDQQKVVESEANGEKSCTETSDRLTEIE